jgi:hypothetical protein
VSISRRDLVRMGSALCGIALASAAYREAEAHQSNDKDESPPVPRPATARGRVIFYGESTSGPYFALSKMPEDVERFTIDQRRAEALGRLVLAAAEKGWRVRVTFTQFQDGIGPAYDIRVTDFRRRRRGRRRREA